MQGKWAASEKARKIQLSNDKWADTLPVQRYVDYREVVVPVMPLLDKVIMSWGTKEFIRRAMANATKRNYTARKTSEGDFYKIKWAKHKANPERHAKAIETKRKWRAVNKDVVSGYKHKEYLKDPEANKKKAAAYHAANRERALKRSKEYYQVHRERLLKAAKERKANASS